MVNLNSWANVCCFAMCAIVSMIVIIWASVGTYVVNQSTKTSCYVDDYQNCTYFATSDSCGASMELEYWDNCDNIEICGEWHKYTMTTYTNEAIWINSDKK